MIIELYARQGGLKPPQSPVSNTAGALPEAEPTLALSDLLGSFSTREEALDYISQQASQQQEQVVESRSSPFNDYTHIEWLTMTIQTTTQQLEERTYYLVTDEGY